MICVNTRMRSAVHPTAVFMLFPVSSHEVLRTSEYHLVLEKPTPKRSRRHKLSAVQCVHTRVSCRTI